MPVRPKDFWGSNFYKNPPLTDEMLGAAERQLGVRLPKRYVELLRIQNGGYTRELFAAPLVDGSSRLQDHVTLSELNGIVPVGDTQADSAHNILLSQRITEDSNLPPKQVLLAGDGHTWISLDYREGIVPAVIVIDADAGTEQVIASSFAEFFAVLRPAAGLRD